MSVHGSVPQERRDRSDKQFANRRARTDHQRPALRIGQRRVLGHAEQMINRGRQIDWEQTGLVAG